VVVILAVSDIFQTREIPGAEAAGVAINTTDIDTCGISTSANGNIIKSGAGSSCIIKATTGIISGNLNVTGGAKVTINAGAKLVLSPGKEIIIDKANGSEIIMATGGDINNGIIHGTVCVRDDDGDGYMNSGTGFSVALNSQPCSSLNSGSDKYIAKTSATSLTEADCYNNDNTKYSCCVSGYRDYDKDGYGKNNDVNSCYPADSAYNIVSNNYDCNDSVAGITNNNTDYNGCGTGACAGTGSDVCTNGVTVNNACVVSAQACCDASGNPKPNGTVISSCSSCNGTSAAPIAYANGTICAYGSYGGYGNSAGSCYIYSSRPYYACSAGSCSGSVYGYDYQYQYPSTTGDVWNGSSWIAANCSTNTGYGSGQYCTTSSYSGYSQRLAYGCTTGGASDTSTPKATCNQSQCLNMNENGVSCTGGNCVGTSNCSDGSDNDGDSYTDALDPQCGGCGQCNSSCGAGCSAQGCYVNGGICSYGGWSAYTNSAGSCYAYRTRAYYVWSNCSCVYAGDDYEYSYGSNGQVWNGSAWAGASSGNKCGTGSYSCSGTTSIQLGYYACNGGNSCSTYMGTYQVGTCSGAENSMCSGGSCQNFCSLHGGDNNGNGYVDDQDPGCPYGGAGQCTSGACCNTANGSYYGTGTVCSYGSCSSPSSGSGCTYTYNNRNCSGSSASCTGGYTASGATCYCGAGTSWNGSSCATSGSSNYCGLGGSYSCSGNNQYVNTLGCNGSGTCNYNTGYTAFNQTCASGSSYWCSGNQAYLRTNGCISGNCTYSDSTTTYCDGSSKICSSGSCITPSCPAGASASGYTLSSALPYGSSVGVTKPAGYRSSGGYYSATATCNSGTLSISGQSGLNCYGGYTYTYGSWYQSTYGYYDVCVLATCAAGSSGGYSWSTLNHGSVTGTSRSITNGSCSANLNCTDGNVVIQNESCSCNSGYSWTGSACVDCVDDSGCDPGYYCYLSTYNPSYDWCTVGTVNSCSRKCWSITQTTGYHTILEGDVAGMGCYTASNGYYDDPSCSGAPACGAWCNSGGSSGILVGSAGGDSCYKRNGLGLKYWVSRNIYKCWSNSNVTKWYGDACAPSNGYTSQSGVMNQYGSCVVPSYCGDWTCNSNEDCSSCANDCGQCVVCGDGMCVSGEDFYSCPDDCPSGGGNCNYNSSCEDYNGESCRSCYNDCYSCNSCNYNGTCDYNEDSSSCYNDCWNI
jgi:hypothetical protein